MSDATRTNRNDDFNNTLKKNDENVLQSNSKVIIKPVSPRKKFSSQMFNQTLSLGHENDDTYTIEGTNSPQKEPNLEKLNKIRIASIERQNEILKEDLQSSEIYSGTNKNAVRMSKLSMVNSIVEEDGREESSKTNARRSIQLTNSRSIKYS